MDSLSLDSRLNELSGLINRISVEEINWRSYAENHDHLDRKTLQNFAEWTISPHSQAVQGMLDQMHTLMVGHPNLDYLGKGSLLMQLALYLQVSKRRSPTIIRSVCANFFVSSVHRRLLNQMLFLPVVWIAHFATQWAPIANNFLGSQELAVHRVMYTYQTYNRI